MFNEQNNQSNALNENEDVVTHHEKLHEKSSESSESPLYDRSSNEAIHNHSTSEHHSHESNSIIHQQQLQEQTVQEQNPASHNSHQSNSHQSNSSTQSHSAKSPLFLNDKFSGVKKVFASISSSESPSSWRSRFANFIQECKRVILLTKKPDKEEFKTIVKVSGLGILLIGVVGFLVHFIREIAIPR